MRRTLIPTALSLIALCFATHPAAAQTLPARTADESPVTVERINAARWRVSAENAEPRVLPPVGDPLRSRVLMPGYGDRVAYGHPVLPVHVLNFGLPPGAELRVRVLSRSDESFPAELTALGQAPATEPLPLVEILPVVTREGLRIGGVRIHPARHDAGTGTLEWTRAFALEISITGGTAGMTVENGAVLTGLVNSADAAAWRLPRPLARRSATRFRAGERLLKIRTAAEGMHRLTYEDAVAAGFDPAGVDPRRFRLLLLGEEQPISVSGEEDGSFDPGDAVTFYAPRNRGDDGGYFDEWMLDNVLLLAWGGEDGWRRGAEDVSPAAHPGAQPLTHFPLQLHLEEDHIYHRGDREYLDMLVTDRVPGEAWVWGYLLKKDTIVTRFDLPAEVSGEGVVRVRARGASVDTSLMRVSLNGTAIGEIRVPPYVVIEPEFSLPPALLRGAGNVLRVENVGLVQCPPENPACSIERFYMDWMQVRLATDISTVSASRTLDARVRVPGFTVPPEYRINTLATGGTLAGINLRTGARLEGIALSGGRAELALDSSGMYHLYAPSAAETPGSVELITMQGYSDAPRQVDYIVVTHRNFMAQAQRLADYRAQADGYSTVVADVEDLYNEFNHGHKDPIAIRRFVRHLWENGPAPKPRFLTILGDASWDPHGRMESSTKTDFVPAFGNPVSDNYYVNFDDEEFDPWPSLAVGRIPAETPASADAVIDKIIAYETAPPQPWDNRFLFSVGGENSFERDVLLRPYVDVLINRWVTPNCIEPRLILKRTLDLVSYDDLDTLIHEVNRGVSWFYFAGHGGTRVIDVGIERPDIFDNEDKYLFFATMSCNTAHFAEPFETGLNERFVISPRNGAVAAYGTSGLGLIDLDFFVSDGMFRALIDSSIRNYGELSMLGKRQLIMRKGAGDAGVQHTVHQLCILGDPATKVPLARTPELAVRPEGIRTAPEILTEQTQTAIFTTLSNYGLCVPDSIDVALTVSAGGTTVFSAQRRIPPLRVDTLLEWTYDFSGVDGQVEIAVEIDVGNRIAERDETNNRAVLNVNVLPRGITQIFPLDRAVISRNAGEGEFLVANPSYVPGEDFNPRMEIEYAADASFTAGVLRMDSEPGPVYTAFAFDPAALDGVYYWRARMVTDAGAERWSGTRSFTIGTDAVGDERWQQSDAPQFAATPQEALDTAPGGGLQLGRRPLLLEAFSGGFNGPLKQAVLRVDGVEYRAAPVDSSRGFNCAVVEPVFGDVVDVRLFDTYQGRDVAAEMTDFLRGIPADHILLAAVQDDANGYPPSSIDGTNITPELRQELERFGARMIDSVGFRDSWAMIGSRAAPQVAQDQHYVLGTVILRDTLTVEAREGRFTTPVIGPANNIMSVQWNGDPGNDSAAVDLRVHALLGDRDTLIAAFEDVPPGQTATLPPSLPLPSAFLRVEGVLRDASGMESPVVRSLRVEYVSRYPEVGVTSQVVASAPDSLLEGEPLTVTAKVYNAGRAQADGLTVRLGIPGTQTAIERALPPLDPDRSEPAEMEFELPTAGLSGAPNFELTIDAANTGTEYYRANNVYSRSFRVGRDLAAPDLRVLFDGVQIADNDFVSPRPVIEIALQDASPLPVTDTSAVQLFLDGRRVWLMSDPNVNYTTGSGDEKVLVEYTPELSDGIHFLAVSGRDASGNAADTIPYQVRFNVSSEQRLDQVIPYPSPTQGPMDFTFRVTGAEPPERARIKLYTVAGRLIGELEANPLDLRIGFNRIAWNGRDADGDALANGVYFYKLIVAQGGEQTEFVGRFAVLR